jgi:hypothetical protein
VEVPGGKTHNLPPLLVKTAPGVKRLDKILNMAAGIIEQEDLVPMAEAPARAVESSVEFSQVEDVSRRRMDLAINLVEQYLGLLTHWQWGDSIVGWIRQCEITFGARPELRNLLRNDVWPHAGRCSFVQLLEDKGVETAGVELEKAVGLRLAFRQMPPIRCCSDQHQTVASTAYQKWQSMSPCPVAALPPERFTFDVVNLSIDVH